MRRFKVYLHDKITISMDSTSIAVEEGHLYFRIENPEGGFNYPAVFAPGEWRYYVEEK